MDYKAIIFDMDGVLFEIEDFYYQRRVDFFKTKGISLKHLNPAIFIGGRASQIWSLILGDELKKWDIPRLEAQYVAYKKSHPAPYGQHVFPEVKKVISDLKEMGFFLAVASNTDLTEVMRALTEAEILSHFDAVFSARDCVACKPHPAVYEKAWDASGVSKEETLVIEDSQKGIAAGIAAGLKVWAIEDKKQEMDQSQAHQKIQNLQELLEKLQRSN